MKRETLSEMLKSKISSLGWKLFIWGLGITKEQYWQRIYEQEKRYKTNSNTEYSHQEIEQLQGKVHEIVGNGKVMQLFNDLLGVNSN